MQLFRGLANHTPLVKTSLSSDCIFIDRKHSALCTSIFLRRSNTGWSVLRVPLCLEGKPSAKYHEVLENRIFGGGNSSVLLCRVHCSEKS